MGFLDKLKAAKNYVTGGSAHVLVEVDDARIGEPFTVRVAAQAGDADVDIRRVYVKIRSVEEVEMPENPGDRHYDVGDGDDDGSYKGPRRESEETYETEVNVTGAVELAAHAHEQWEVQVTLPASCMPTYRGRNAQHRWLIFAGLDVPGNDPDSGWVDFEVK